jgi:N-acetylglucosaminyldiphosphoundecaprenol N-acetyl-beta-D-mannosaminyltransferase
MREVADAAIRGLLVDALADEVVAIDAERAAENHARSAFAGGLEQDPRTDQVCALGQLWLAGGDRRAGLRGQMKNEPWLFGVRAQRVEGASDVRWVGNVAFDELDARRQGRFDILARRGVEIFQGHDRTGRWMARVRQPMQQCGADVPHAGQQRRHRPALCHPEARLVNPERHPARSVDVLGMRVDDVTYAEALAILRQAIHDRVPHVVTTPNPEFAMLARREHSFRAALDRASLNIPDGIGLVLAARLAGDQLREHVQGTDLVLMLAADSAKRGDRWFLLGGRGDVAERTARVLERDFPGLLVAGAMPGSPLVAEDVTSRSAILAAGQVDVLLVAYGAPKQEYWLDRNLVSLGIPVGIGVGGVFDYLSGSVPRAPRWVRRLHFEWCYRLISQPWRWRRQLVLPHFAALAVWNAARRRLGLRAGRRSAAP